MAKRALLSSFSFLHEVNTNKNEGINWKFCVLCQEEKDQELSYPNDSSTSVYTWIKTQLQALCDFGLMPINVSFDSFNDGSGIRQTLERNNACYHRSCRSTLTIKLGRKEQSHKRKTMDDCTENFSPAKKRLKYSPKPTELNICFFCDESSKGHLHSVSTFNLNNMVNEAATELNDVRLMAKLAIRDMMAADAKYHLNCYVKLLNRYRSHNNRKNNKHVAQQVSAEALAFAELVAYIEETRNDECVIVFKLSDLRKKYANRLAEMKEGEVSKSIHSTTLKERLQEHIPDLWVSKQGKEVFLTLSENIGPAIQYAHNSEMDKFAVNLANIVRLVRK